MAFWNFQSCWVLHIFSSSHMWNCGFIRTITFGNIFKPHWKLWKMACLRVLLLELPSLCTCGRKWFSRKRPFFPPSWTDWKLFDHDEEDAAAIQIHGIWGAAWNDDLVWNYSINLFWPLNMPLGQWILLRGWWNPKPPSYEAYLSYLPIIAHPLRHLLEKACSPDARFFSIRGSLISRGKSDDQFRRSPLSSQRRVHYSYCHLLPYDLFWVDAWLCPSAGGRKKWI